MVTVKCFILFCILIDVVENNLLDNPKLNYQGQDFPKYYLYPDGQTPNEADLELYLDRVFRITDYFSQNINRTGADIAFAAFLGTAVLTRTLQDYGHMLHKYRKYIKILANNMANLVSHFIVDQKRNIVEYDVVKILRDPTPNAHSLGTFKSGVLKKWLLRCAPVNEFIAEMDQLTLRMEEYAVLVEAVDDKTKYFINSDDSDYCLAGLTQNMDPVNMTDLQPCKMDLYCKQRMFAGPSVAYTLSHRALASMMYVHNRRCYHFSPEADNVHIDMLCANMYREMVYIARNRYFARDIFIEHLAICSQMGYKEFNRRYWYHKIANWVDIRGCMQESRQFDVNSTSLAAAKLISKKMVQQQQRASLGTKQKQNVPATFDRVSSLGNEWNSDVEWIKKHVEKGAQKDCQTHTMTVTLLALSNGIRYAVHSLVDKFIADK